MTTGREAVLDLSVVVPMYDEEGVLPLLVGRLRPVLDEMGIDYEVVAVDDGSRDLTAPLLDGFTREWPELRVVRLRANAGHQAAISAGLTRSRGSHVVTIDADLQDPPEVIPLLFASARASGVDVVYGVRSNRSTDSRFKRASAACYYRLVAGLGTVSPHQHAGDFRLMSRATVEAVVGLPETNRVLRLIVPALGFPSTTVEYTRERRAAGESKYPLSTMVKLAVDSFTGFSVAPLRAATVVGLGAGLLAFLYGLYVVGNKLVGHTVPGWASTTVVVSALGAVQLVCLGLLGEYVGRTYVHLQGRPSFFVAHDSLDQAGPVHGVDARSDRCLTCGSPLRSGTTRE